MPGTPVLDDNITNVEDHGDRGGGSVPPPGRDDGGDDQKHRRFEPPSPKRYYTGIALGIVSILMFFMALASAYLVRRATSSQWTPIHLPAILWVNSLILLGSSAAIERARKQLLLGDFPAFRSSWLLTTGLGLAFLAGQLIAWRQLSAQGIYVATNQASGFFYIFTALHGVHLIGGVTALVYVSQRKIDSKKVPLAVAVDVTSYYWHFMDGLWIFLLAILYMGK
jgi:cytochrome c oxidase subunit III